MARLTRNSYKRKIILFGAFVFMSIALISTGFAAWVMSADDEITEDGNVDVGIVKDSTIDIIIDDLEELQAFNFLFEPAEGDVKADGNRVHLEDLGDGQTGPHESLKLVFSGSLTNPGNLKENGLTVQLSVPAGIKKAAELNYIVLPDCIDAAKVITLEADGTFECVVEFKWGSAFKGMNPSKYFDEDTDGIKVSNPEVRKTLENLRACVYGYYADLIADGADREAIIASHAADAVPTFTLTIKALAK